MRSLTRLLLVAGVAAAIATGSLALRVDAQTPPPPREPPRVMVEVAEAVKLEFAPQHWAPGSVVSREDARVASELGGRVVAVAGVGQHVRRGEALARLDDAALRLREQDDQANLARIQAQFDYAAAQAVRYERLAAQANIAGAQLDQARSEQRVLEQELARARVALAQTRHQLSQSVVRAPFDGVVAERFTQRGEYLGTGAPVVRLVNPQALEVRVRAPVELAGRLAADTPVSLRVGDATRERRVTALVPVGDETSRQLELRVALDDPSLTVGVPVEVGLPSAAPHGAVAVPRDALVLRRAGAFVMRVTSDATAERVPVEVGQAQDGFVEVGGGINPGDLLVVRGGERLQPGQKVQWPAPLAMAVSKP